MNDFVKALIHVHGKTDEKAQWKRAVESVEHMSIMEIAVAWQTLAHHVSRSQLPASALSEMKVLYKNALREYKENQAPASQPCTINKHLKQLTEEIRGLRTAVCMDHSGGMVNPFHPKADDEPIEDDSPPRTPSSDMIVSSGTVSVDADRPVHAHTAEVGTAGPTAMDDLIKKCCAETSRSNSELKDEVKGMHSDLLRRWDEYETTAKQLAKVSGNEIREIIKGRFRTQDAHIIDGFSNQNDAMVHHEEEIEQIVEQTGQTMETILSILQSHDAFTRKQSDEHGEIMKQLSKIMEQSQKDSAELKATVETSAGARGKTMAELNANTTKAVSEFVNALAVLRELYNSHERQTLGMIAETRELLDDIKHNLSKESQAKSGGTKRAGNRKLEPEGSPYAASARPNRRGEVSDPVQKMGDPLHRNP